VPKIFGFENILVQDEQIQRVERVACRKKETCKDREDELRFELE